MMSKCGENKKAALGAQPSVSLMFLPHSDILCGLYCTYPRQHGIYLFCCSVIDRRRKLQIKMRE